MILFMVLYANTKEYKTKHKKISIKKLITCKVNKDKGEQSFISQRHEMALLSTADTDGVCKTCYSTEEQYFTAINIPKEIDLNQFHTKL